jgi:uncharacterized damage-inducible protein DinB
MTTTQQLEVWQRGPLPGITSLLQPAAHAILQCREEVQRILENFPETLLWQKPAGVASVGFHLKHIPGVLDRLFTYAKGEMLSGAQMEYLSGETKDDHETTLSKLLDHFNRQVDKAIDQLQHTNENDLLQPRGVGRKQIPTNVIGLLFHAAEHCQRHTGQLLVTARVLKPQRP